MSITILIALGCAFAIFILIMGITALLRARSDEANDRVMKRLRSFAITEAQTESIDLIAKQSNMSDLPWFNRMLGQLSFASNLKRLIQQGNAKGSTAVYILACVLLGILGLYMGLFLSGRILVAAGMAAALAYTPIFYLNHLRNKRLDRFQQQFPDALDLMSRALKAGHTFSGGMRMVADEFDNPIGNEFRITLEEINFGMDVDRALANLQERMPVSDLKFFIVSINIQRETGGNLAEIISNIARLVRERFILFGKIRVLSAEGRISAILLTALPFAITLVLYFLNPGYISLLWTTTTGQTMAWGAVISMGMGIVFMRRMVKIKV